MDVRGKTSNEKRLIDADRAMEIVRNQGIAHPNAYHLTNYATLILRESPTVDAVEVVRCRECKWWHEDDDVGYCDNPDGLDNYAKPDEFCSYRERKEGAN